MDLIGTDLISVVLIVCLGSRWGFEDSRQTFGSPYKVACIGQDRHFLVWVGGNDQLDKSFQSLHIAGTEVHWAVQPSGDDDWLWARKNGAGDRQARQVFIRRHLDRRIFANYAGM